MFRRCHPNISCGISDRFQPLSPSERQVAHVLLTRPPLFHARRHFTVRLECVRHAASVHPEPGSNSLKKLYIKLYSESAGFRTDFAVLNSLHGLFSLDTVFSELFDVCSILWIYLLIRVSKELSRFCDYLFLVSTSSVSFGSLTALYLIYLLLFNFQGPSLCRSLEFLSCATWILYHILSHLSRGFAKVFWVFFALFCLLAWRDLYIISYSFAFVKRFLKSF